MKNRRYNTGICEETHSKRVIVGALSGAKEHLGGEVLTVRSRSLRRQFFDGVVNVDGCVCLTGADVDGVCLVDARTEASDGGNALRAPVSFGDREPSPSSPVDFKTLFRSLVEASIVVRRETGSLPRLFINGVLADFDGDSFAFFPPQLAEFLASYLSEEKRKSVFFVAGSRPVGASAAPPSERYPGETAFARSCARFVYRLFAVDADPVDSPVYFLGDRAPGFPRPLADLVWSAMRDGPVDLESLLDALERSEREPDGPPGGLKRRRVPLRKRRWFIAFTHSLGRFLASKWRLFLLVLAVGAILAYILFDFASGKKTTSTFAGLSPRGVVEQYYSAMGRLDLDAVQSLLRRRAGRKTINELSTLYVMAKLGGAYGAREGAPENAGLSGVLSIGELDIEQVSAGSAPVFRARYRKTIRAGGAESEYRMDETLTVERIRDRWCIVNVESEILE